MDVQAVLGSAHSSNEWVVIDGYLLIAPFDGMFIVNDFDEPNQLRILIDVNFEMIRELFDDAGVEGRINMERGPYPYTCSVEARIGSVDGATAIKELRWLEVEGELNISGKHEKLRLVFPERIE